DENFKKCVRDYLKAYSIRSFNLLDAGEFFSEYIASSPLLEKFPFLSDLAALEYAHLKAFHFFEVSRIEESELLKLFSVDPFFVRVELHPSVFLIKSKWNLKEIYNHPKNRVDKGIYFFIVYEKLKEVFIKKVEEEMYNLLLSFKNNATLGDSLFILGDQPKKIQEAFKMIATEGWMSQVTVDRESQ
ncbi:MAG: hypothetical protein CL678_12110, partial [Bdellovibrionaceae bacterium]|nr:hypothetical protein [Pseudobdellovibrionaceae bacterium]